MDDLETQQPDAPADTQSEAAPQPDVEAEQPAATLDELLPDQPEQAPGSVEDSQLKAVLEAIVYVAEEPLTLAQLAASLQQPTERIRAMLDELIAEFDQPQHGVTIREVAGGF